VNVLFLNYSLHGQGGSQMTSISLAEALVRRGHRVFYGSAAGPLVERLRTSGIGFVDLPIHRRWPELQNLSWGNIRRIARLVADERIDLIHAFQYYPALAAALSRLSRPVPVVLSLLGPALPSFELPCGIAHVFAVSEELRGKVLSRGLARPEILSVLPNRIDFRRYGECRDNPAEATRIGLTPGSPRVCLISTMIEQKLEPIRIFLKSASLLAPEHPSLELVVAGNGPCMSVLREEAERVNRGIGRSMLFLPGTVDVAAVLGMFQVVVGMGRTALEGMTAGKPVVVVGPTQVVTVAEESSLAALSFSNFTGRGGTPAGDPAAALAGAITRLLRDPEGAAAIGQQGQAFVREHYDVDYGAARLEACYHSALEAAIIPGRLASARHLAGFAVRRVLLTLRRRTRPPRPD
jgi:glycosyltransferase involved in cell wall biosynthesis